MRWRFFVSEAVASVRNNLATTVAASVTVLIVTLLVGSFAYVTLIVRKETNTVRDQVVVKAYLPTGTDKQPAVLTKVHNELAAIPGLKSIRYVSPQDALNELSRTERANIATLGYNPLPPAFELRMKNPDQYQRVSNDAMKVDEVRNCGSPPCVVNGAQKTQRVLFVVRVAQLVFGILMLLLGAAAIVLIANTIRLSIFSRRREIEVMKLVGATNWFVRVPFVLEGVFTGLVGSVLGVLVLAAGYEGLGRINGDLKTPANVYPGGVWMLGITLAAFGLLLGAFGSALTLRRFLKV